MSFRIIEFWPKITVSLTSKPSILNILDIICVNALCGGLREIGWDIPDSQGTMFAWGKIPKGYTDDVAFVMELLKKSGVLCTPGSSFGKLGKGHVRFALTMPVSEIREAVAAIAASGMIIEG